jgi:hypothetical protein
VNSIEGIPLHKIKLFFALLHKSTQRTEFCLWDSEDERGKANRLDIHDTRQYYGHHAKYETSRTIRVLSGNEFEIDSNKAMLCVWYFFLTASHIYIFQNALFLRWEALKCNILVWFERLEDNLADLTALQHFSYSKRCERRAALMQLLFTRVLQFAISEVLGLSGTN